jgi:hypothetical protein
MRRLSMISKMLAGMSAAIFLAALAHGATVTGTVKGPDGAPFKGAFVQAQNTKTKITVNVLSHKDGAYRVEDLPAGEYVLRIRAVGYEADPRTGVTLTANQSASMDWALKPGTVRWRDLSLYQGEKLIPNIRGKEMVFGPLSNFRDAPCQICHGFQTRMASVSRDLEGAKDRVDYMRTRMHYLLAPMVDDAQADKVASFISSAFGPDSQLPKSPADLPEYKNLVHTFDDDAMNIVYVEYDLPGPNRMPWSAAPDKEGNLWMPYYGGANKIGELDPETAKVKEYDVPNPNAVGIHSAYPGPDGNVWLGEFGINKVGKFDPKTEKLTEYADDYLPGKEGLVVGGSKHTVRTGPDGIAWSSGSRISRLDPKTGKFTDFNEPTLRRRPGQRRQLLVHGIQRRRENRKNRRQNSGSENLDSSRKQHRVLTQDSGRFGRHRLVQPIRRWADWPVRSQNGNLQELRVAGAERQSLCNEPGPQPRRLVFLGISGRSGPLEHHHRQGDRISVPSFRNHVEGIFPRCAGPHVVRDALQQ